MWVSWVSGCPKKSRWGVRHPATLVNLGEGYEERKRSREGRWTDGHPQFLKHDCVSADNVAYHHNLKVLFSCYPVLVAGLVQCNTAHSRFGKSVFIKSSVLAIICEVSCIFVIEISLKMLSYRNEKLGAANTKEIPKSLSWKMEVDLLYS